jgi:flagellar L-ring protein precursor FlgH
MSKGMTMLVVLLALAVTGTVEAQALWRGNGELQSMYAPKPEKFREYKVGDHILVRINEQMDAQRRDSLETSRETELDVSFDQYIRLGNNGNLLPGNRQLGVAGSAEFDSTNEGQRRRRSSFADTVTAEITQILPGYDPEEGEGLFVIRAFKSITMMDDTETVELTGRVSLRHINTQNDSVDASRIFGADIRLRGDGDVTRASRQGWFTRTLNSLWPF